MAGCSLRGVPPGGNPRAGKSVQGEGPGSCPCFPAQDKRFEDGWMVSHSELVKERRLDCCTWYLLLRLNIFPTGILVAERLSTGHWPFHKTAFNPNLLEVQAFEVLFPPFKSGATYLVTVISCSDPAAYPLWQSTTKTIVCFLSALYQFIFTDIPNRAVDRI